MTIYEGLFLAALGIAAWIVKDMLTYREPRQRSAEDAEYDADFEARCDYYGTADGLPMPADVIDDHKDQDPYDR